MNNLTLYMIGNAHIDPVWLWQWQEGFREVHATFRSALDLMKEYPEFVFTASSAAFYEWIEFSDPQMFSEIRQRVSEGRWGLVGGWWIEPDCNIPSGESFARQGLYAQRYFMKKFGRIAKVGYNVDSFGHNGMLPQILGKCGLDYYVFMRPMPHEKELPGRLFWWESQDGSRILTYRLPFTYATWGNDLTEHVNQCAGEVRPPLSEGMCFYGVGDHGGGPTRQNLESIRQLSQKVDSLTLVGSTPDAFFLKVQEQEKVLPVLRADLQHHASGCYAAHSMIKRWNRQAENSLLAAEKFASIAAVVTGQVYPADFSNAWKAVLFNQFHDILAGTSLEVSYEDARSSYGLALSIADRALTFAVQSLTSNIYIPTEEKTQPILVFNPHAWAVRAPVELEYNRIQDGDLLLDESGQSVPFQQVHSAATTLWRRRLSFIADLPPLGYRVYRHISLANHAITLPALQAGEDFIENDFLRLEVDANSGNISRLFDKRLQVNVFNGPAAKAVVVYDPSDTWSHAVLRFDQEIGQFSSGSVRLVESGPVKATLRAISQYGTSQLVQEFSLYAGLDRVEVKAQVDWHERHKLLKLRFPVNVRQARVVNEIAYGHIQRLANGDEEPMHSWVDVAGFLPETGEPYGLSLLNDGKYSFDAHGNDLGLTVLRSPIFAHHEPAVPQPDEFYAYMDQGIQRFSYILLPHAGSWMEAGTVRVAAELNQPPFAFSATYHPRGKLPQNNSFIRVEPENILVTVLKMAEEGDNLILRAYETHQKPARAIIHLPFIAREIEAGFGPCEIKTFCIPRQPNLPVSEVNLLEWEDR